MQALDFRFTLTETYTFWSGLIGGLFLMLSYFGCDQSQVQRYLTAKSPEEGRQSLMMSAYAKIPLQAVILLTGVLVFTFYLFTRPPMLFNPEHEQAVRASAEAPAYAALESRFAQAFEDRQRAARAVENARGRRDAAAVSAGTAAFTAADATLAAVRDEAVTLVKRVSGNEQYNDINYVFPTFVTTRMPIGLVGLMIAAIFAAAMSSIAAELNSLATATVIDFYQRYFRRAAPDAHYLRVSRAATAVWGLVACGVAVYATSLGSLIEVVNRFGSFFYGSLLGVFVLAIGTSSLGAQRSVNFGGLSFQFSEIAKVLMIVVLAKFFADRIDKIGSPLTILGGLTTFSTFSAEIVGLLARANYGWALILAAAHLAGSLIATIGGIFLVRWMSA